MRIFTYEEGEWTVKGRFTTALKENDPISWANENGELNLSVALVCAYLIFIMTLLMII
jgi:hypothetical protein